MKLLLTPSSLRGTVTVPPSKSLLHRELICRFLAGQVTELPAPRGTRMCWRPTGDWPA